MSTATIPVYLTELFTNQVKNNHRTVLIMSGNNSKQQIPVLHEKLSRISSLGNVVWCYKNTETFLDKEKKKIKASDEDDDLTKWIKAVNPEYISHAENSRILGQTCDMLIIQDFEAFTPNMIACTIETVRGGGVLVLLFNDIESVKEIVARPSEFITENVGVEHVPRFNRRFFRLLSQQEFVVFLDSKLRIMENTKKMEFNSDQPETRFHCLSDDPLLGICKTENQMNVLQSLIAAIDKNEATLTSVIAARGRGKSAALGLAVSYAVGKNLPLVLITSLFVDNVQAIFNFIINGLEKQGYKKMVDYKIVYLFERKKKLISKIEIVRNYKRVIEYVHPFEESKICPNLLVIDEAASIPLPYLKKMLEGARLVFMATTVNGYEGTGRVFKTKLIEHIKTRNIPHAVLEMNEPIRYSNGDQVEKWLGESLILEPTVHSIMNCPMPTECSVFWINKDVLFSGHPASEMFLSEAFSLFVASHYKNSPNDIQILSDSPNHEIFVLMTPQKPWRIICAIQVSFEGRCSKTAFTKEGNLVPWVVYDNFFEESFLQSFGARIVRIACHPNLLSMGYGTRTLLALKEFLKASIYEGSHVSYENSNVLLHPIDKIKTPRITWIGSSFGLTEKLMNFWKKTGFSPVCIKQTPSKSTGEFSALVLDSKEESFDRMRVLFLQRLVPLLSFAFKEFSPTLSISLIYSSDFKAEQKKFCFTTDEIDRLKMFSKGMLDVRSILDVLPDLARVYFYQKDLNGMPLISQSVLLMVGCQKKSTEEVSEYFSIEEYKVRGALVCAVDTILRRYGDHLRCSFG